MSGSEPPDGGRGVVLQITGRLREELERQINALRDEFGGAIADIRGKLDKLTAAKDDEGPLPFWPGDLAPDEWHEQRAELGRWVDDVFAPTHPTVAGRLPSCWAEHPAALEAVLAAWFAWCGAYRGKSRRPDDPARWLRDVLPNLDKQLAAEFTTATPRTNRPVQCTNPDHATTRSHP